MSRLKQQIKAVEKNIQKNNRIIRQSEAELAQYIFNQQFLVLGLLGSFFTGYFLARKKTVPHLIRLSLRLALKAERFYSQMNVILPLIKRE